jgi:hypothetical protein
MIKFEHTFIYDRKNKVLQMLKYVETLNDQIQLLKLETGILVGDLGAV